MSAIDDLQTLSGGLQEKLRAVRAQIGLFNKAKGLLEEEEKLRAEAVTIRDKITKEKEHLSSLQEKKNSIVKQAVEPMAARMNEVLPAGEAVIRIDDDGSVFIGMKSGQKTVPYAGLSGGEKAAFDPALCKALGGTVLIVEAAELDQDHLTEALEKYATTDIQTLVSSCHIPNETPEGWKVVGL